VALATQLVEGFLEMIYPTRCAGCDLPGGVLCDECRTQIARIEPATACPRCGAPFGWLICTECWDRELAFSQAISVGTLEHPLSRAVTVYKDAGERRLAQTLAELLARAVEPWRWWIDIVTYVPATIRAQHRRGFDHAADISAALAGLLGVSHAAVLTRRRGLDQRVLGRTERMSNAEGTFEVIAPVDGNVLLVDDVLTTGATVDDAARALAEGGADEVRVVTVARAW